MRIVVPLKAVPDLVEEIEFTPDGTGIDREFLKFVLNEWDDQALEEALLIKEAAGGEVAAVGLADDPDIDQALYTALAKGADRAIKISGGAEDTHSRAALLDYRMQNEGHNIRLKPLLMRDRRCTQNQRLRHLRRLRPSREAGGQRERDVGRRECQRRLRRAADQDKRRRGDQAAVRGLREHEVAAMQGDFAAWPD